MIYIVTDYIPVPVLLLYYLSAVAPHAALSLFSHRDFRPAFFLGTGITHDSWLCAKMFQYIIIYSIHTNSPTLCHYTSLGKINSTAMTGYEPGRKVSAKRWDELMSGKRLGEGVTGP